MAIDVGAMLMIVVGLPVIPYTPGLTAKVILPAVVPVEKAMLCWPLSSRALSPALTVKLATRLLVATNWMALSSVTVVIADAKLSVTVPDAVTGDAVAKRMASVCCSSLEKLLASNGQTGAGNGEE